MRTLLCTFRCALSLVVLNPRNLHEMRTNVISMRSYWVEEGDEGAPISSLEVLAGQKARRLRPNCRINPTRV